VSSQYNLSYDRYIVPPSATSPECGPSVYSFNFQYLLVSLSLLSGRLPLLPRFPVTSTFTSISALIIPFRRQFLHKMWH